MQQVYAVAKKQIVGVFNNPVWDCVTSQTAGQAPKHVGDKKILMAQIEKKLKFFSCEEEDIREAFNRISNNNIIDDELNGNGSSNPILYFNC